jgi:hypothetical protein
MQTEGKDPSDDRVTFAASISTDRDQFYRRACPSCGREFKTQVDPSDLQWALAAQCRRMGLEVGEEHTDDAPADRIRCPFCDHEAPGSEMHTDETVEYLKRLVYREFVLPQMNKLFSGLEDSLGHGHRGGGFLSISLEFKHSRSLLPVRPIHGPESADMTIVEFLCCSKRIKIPDSWRDLQACSYCGAAVVLI